MEQAKHSVEEELSSFILRAKEANKPIAFVTSGGTSVPIEKNTVRSIENFSSGKRGAISTEYFLKKGYYVILLKRKFSLQPFKVRVDINELFDSELEGDKIENAVLGQAIRDHRIYKDQLFELDYVNLIEFLHQLEFAMKAINKHSVNSLSYLAAAVSDFYLPEEDMPDHKIQSREHVTLDLKLQPAPKKLSIIKSEWCPSTFCISFKLETDLSILEQKALSAIENYGVDMVIANQLATHRFKVIAYNKDKSSKKIETEYQSKLDVEKELIDYITEKSLKKLKQDFLKLKHQRQKSMTETILERSKNRRAQHQKDLLEQGSQQLAYQTPSISGINQVQSQRVAEPKWKKYMDSYIQGQVSESKFMYENNFTFNKNHNTARKKLKEAYESREATNTVEDDTHFETCAMKLSDILLNSDIYNGITSSQQHMFDETDDIDDAEVEQFNMFESEDINNDEVYQRQIQQLEFDQWSLTPSNIRQYKDVSEETTPYISVKKLLMSDQCSLNNYYDSDQNSSVCTQSITPYTHKLKKEFLLQAFDQSMQFTDICNASPDQQSAPVLPMPEQKKNGKVFTYQVKDQTKMRF